MTISYGEASFLRISFFTHARENLMTLGGRMRFAPRFQTFFIGLSLAVFSTAGAKAGATDTSKVEIVESYDGGGEAHQIGIPPLADKSPYTYESAPQLLSSTTSADANWSNDFGLPGLNREIFAAHELNGKLYVAGYFRFADGEPILGLAVWDGLNYSAVGSPPDGVVTNIGEYQGSLIVTGRFTGIGGISAQNIARYDGTNWYPLGEGLDNVSADFLDYDGKLIVRGHLTNVGPDSVVRIAAWDGVSWSQYAEPAPIGVAAMTIYNGELVIGGGTLTETLDSSFNNIARWDGTSWSALGAGVNSTIYDLVVHNGKLIVGGSFDQAGGSPALHTASWDGSVWDPMDGANVNSYNRTEILSVVNNELYCMGSFNTSTGFAHYLAARWTGTVWDVLTDFQSLGRVRAISSFNSNVVFVGERGARVGLCVQLNGTEFEPLRTTEKQLLGLDYWTLASTIYQGEVAIAGLFSEAGGITTNFVAIGDGTHWSTLGDGVPGYVNTLGTYGSKLVAGGAISVHIWNNGEWQMLGSGQNASYRSPISALAEYEGQLIAGGNFALDGQEGANIAAWDGAQWTILNGGLNGHVRSLEVLNGQLYVGGDFTTAGATASPAPYVATWNGTAWSSIGELPGPVYDFDHYGSRIMAAGGSTSSPAFGFVATWNGFSWDHIGDGMLTSKVEDVTTLGCEIYAGGHFGKAYPGDAPEALQFISRWDGATWTALGSGFDAQVFALQSHNGKLFVGGCFTALATSDIPAQGFSIWTPPTGSNCCNTPGDADRSGAVTIGDVTHLLNMIFVGGPQPCCMDESDSNGDSATTIGDVTYVISHIFSAGPAPICGSLGR
ncbi:hypothetical protein JYT16_00955 [Gemmatimonas aurantiaca]|nr:hypothetical protein [Gemmatimonas aurantiaca]